MRNFCSGQEKKKKTEQTAGASLGSKRMAPKVFKSALSGGECIYCGATYSPTAQICPECGMGVGDGSCTFCVNIMPSGASVCPHCGNPADGIECQECGTVNFRNFCRSCGASLNSRAALAIDRFKADPKFRQAEQIGVELKKIRDYIEGKSSALDLTHNDETLATDALTDMPADYAALFSCEFPASVEKTPPIVSSASSVIQHKPEARTGHEKSKKLSVKDAMKLYAEKKAEMDALLDSIVPPLDLSPEEQRDFCSARQTVVRYTETSTITTSRRYWICNYCCCQHNEPPECAEPWHGGVWITNNETHTTTSTTITLETLKD